MNKPQTSNQQPTVFHITHWKAGSQWLHKILLELHPERIVSPRVNERQFLETPLVCAAIYPTVYITKEQFYSITLPTDYRKFVIIRDLRDTLVSGYFSIRYSHTLIDDRLARWRNFLNAMSTEAGLLMLLDEWLPGAARIQESWIAASEKIIRYEELLDRDCEILEQVLINECEIAVSPERLHSVIVSNRFEKLTGGRKPGEENLFVHERKGVSGDWKNHFTSLIADKFDERYGTLLTNSGYEQTRTGFIG